MCEKNNVALEEGMPAWEGSEPGPGVSPFHAGKGMRVRAQEVLRRGSLETVGLRWVGGGQPFCNGGL